MVTLNMSGKKPFNVWMESGVTRYPSAKVKDVLNRNDSGWSL